MRMKKLLIPILCLCLILCGFLPAMATSADTKNDKAGEKSNLNITVVVPEKKSEPKEEPKTESKKEPPTPTVTPIQAAPPKQAETPKSPLLYPVNVWENETDGRIEIVKTYELTASEKPENIPTASFTKNGILYELSDIIKHDNSGMDKKDHVETVTLDSNTQNVDAILKLLAPSLEYKSEDGYVGILELDVSSIKTEQSGTKKSNYTVTATREYPHLSSNDTSLVPRTINENGKTLTLSNVSWKAETAEAIDYNQLPVSYRAIATYSANASKTVVTGYTTTAIYKGSISKTITGKAVYTAHFIGTTLAPEYIYEDTYAEKSFITPTNNDDFRTTETVLPNNNGNAIKNTVSETTKNNSSNALLYIVLAVTLFSISLNGFICFKVLYNKNKKKESDSI